MSWTWRLESADGTPAGNDGFGDSGDADSGNEGR